MNYLEPQASSLKALLFCWAVMMITCGVAAMIPAPTSAAVFTTKNFQIECAYPEIAQEVALAAEERRAALWIEWTGAAPPDNWANLCDVRVRVGPNIGAGGATGMAYDLGEAFGFGGSWQGSRERLLDSVVPHEVLHCVLASHFRQALPRAIDEGICTTTEHESELDNHRRVLWASLRDGRAYGLNQLLALTEYPADMRQTLTMYAQGWSLVEYLLTRGSKQDLIRWCEVGLATGKDWNAALRQVYGIEHTLALQTAWLDWLRAGTSPRVRFVGYGGGAPTMDANGCLIFPDGTKLCAQQAEAWMAQNGYQIQSAQVPAPQQRATIPRTFAGVEARGPRGGGISIGAGATPAATAQGCNCGPLLEAFGKRLDGVEQRVAELRQSLDAKVATIPAAPDLSAYAKKSEVPELAPVQPVPDLTEYATLDQVEAKERTLLERIKAAASKAKAVGGVVVAAKDAAAAGSGGLFAGWSFGTQIAALLGLSAFPPALAGVIGMVAYRRLKKRIASMSSGGSSASTFPKPGDPYPR